MLELNVVTAIPLGLSRPSFGLEFSCEGLYAPPKLIT
jgi:hypothetical protein